MAIFSSSSGAVTITYVSTLDSSVITNIQLYTSQEGTDMSDQHALMRVTLDLPVDPSTATERVIKAIGNEARDYVQVVLVKDREVTLTDHVELVDVHVHRSAGGDACAACVQDLALDGRS